MLRGAGPLLGSAHLEPSLAVTLAAGALALGAGLGHRTALVMLAVGSGQVSIGWSNDWLDHRRDRAAGRTDKPVAQDRVTPRTVLHSALASALVCVGASLALGATAAAVHLPAVACGWFYNVRAKHTWYSVVPWAVAFGLLPAAVTLTTPVHRWPAWWMLVAGAVLGAGAHFANALPDLDADRATGVTGLPHRLGRRRAQAVAVGLIAVGIAAVAAGMPAPAGVRALVAAGGVLALTAIALAIHRNRDRTAFRMVVVLLVALAAAVVIGGTILG